MISSAAEDVGHDQVGCQQSLQGGPFTGKNADTQAGAFQHAGVVCALPDRHHTARRPGGEHIQPFAGFHHPFGCAQR